MACIITMSRSSSSSNGYSLFLHVAMRGLWKRPALCPRNYIFINDHWVKKQEDSFIPMT